MDVETQTIETYQDGVLIHTETIEVVPTEHDLERRAIVSQWQGRKQAVIDALAGIEAQRDTIIAANTAVQQASTTAQLSAAVKQYAQTNLVVLGGTRGAYRSDGQRVGDHRTGHYLAGRRARRDEWRRVVRG